MELLNYFDPSVSSLIQGYWDEIYDFPLELVHIYKGYDLNINFKYLTMLYHYNNGDIKYPIEFLYSEATKHLNVMTTRLKTLRLSFYTGSLDFLIGSNLEELKLDTYNGDINVIKNISTLKILILPSYKGDISFLSNLNLKRLNLGILSGDLSVLSEMKNLETLELPQCCSDIPNLTSLKRLSIGWLKDTLPNLEYLSVGILSGNILSKELEYLEIMSYLYIPIHLPKLKILKLIGYYGCINFSLFPKLEELSLASCPIEDIGLLENLRILEINIFKKEDLKYLKRLKKLTHLHMGSYSKDISGLKDIPSLKEVSVNSFSGNRENYHFNILTYHS